MVDELAEVGGRAGQPGWVVVGVGRRVSNMTWARSVEFLETAGGAVWSAGARGAEVDWLDGLGGAAAA